MKGFDINSVIGLSEHEAAQRLKEEGFNELPSTMHTEAGSKVALPLLFISFGNHQLPDHPAIAE